MQPPHRSITFGERDWQELRVEPKYGKIGTDFSFKAFRFERQKKVKVVIKGPDDFLVHGDSMTTDDDGSIKLSYTASGDWPPGKYTFSVNGFSMTFDVAG